MCYSLPGPRCSDHARVNLEKATINLATARENFKNSETALKAASGDVDKAEFFAHKKFLTEAKKEVAKAQKVHDVHQEKRAVAIDAYKEKKKEWYATPEGIQELRDAGENEKADRFTKYRASQIRQFKRAEEAKEAQKAVATVMEKPTQNAKPAKIEPNQEEEKPLNPKDYSYMRLKKMADNPETSAAHLTKLSKVNKEYVRSAVAQNPNAPKEVLRKLATDRSESVRKSLAERDFNGEDVDIQEALCDDQSPRGTGVSIARNLSTSPIVLNSIHESGYHHEELAGNANLPHNLREKLAENRSGIVRSILAHTPNTPVSILKNILLNKEMNIDDHVARYMDRNTPMAVGEILSESKDRSVRSYVARLAPLPMEVLQKLSIDEDEYVRENAIKRLGK